MDAKVSMDYMKIGKRSEQINSKNQKWIPPHNNNAYKANCDANLGLDGYQCIATVIRDSQRKVIAASSWKEHGPMVKIGKWIPNDQRRSQVTLWPNCCMTFPIIIYIIFFNKKSDLT